MQVATILPTRYLWLEADSDYHLCLAHLLHSDPEYANFFKEQSRRGSYVIMDNGVVETGEAMPIEELMELADCVEASEIILPDVLRDKDATLGLSEGALIYAQNHGWCGSIMAVPQGNTPEEWKECLEVMVTWPVTAIGISRFLVPEVYPNRAEALRDAYDQLTWMDKCYHLLGCPGHPQEIWDAYKVLPQSVRGTDSGIAAIYTEAGLLAEEGHGKPDVELNFSAGDGYAEYDADLLMRNYAWWKRSVRGLST